ncbi:hypothetical protein SPONN_827 [uncultured Candidatus Thioglobus sp.]|nr:hypothetical protein SPONN_827 [uncultured Candidatus Thioglobus sp.]
MIDYSFFKPRRLNYFKFLLNSKLPNTGSTLKFSGRVSGRLE